MLESKSCNTFSDKLTRAIQKAIWSIQTKVSLSALKMLNKSASYRAFLYLVINFVGLSGAILGPMILVMEGIDGSIPRTFFCSFVLTICALLASGSGLVLYLLREYLREVWKDIGAF